MNNYKIVKDANETFFIKKRFLFFFWIYVKEYACWEERSIKKTFGSLNSARYGVKEINKEAIERKNKRIITEIEIDE